MIGVVAIVPLNKKNFKSLDNDGPCQQNSAVSMTSKWLTLKWQEHHGIKKNVKS